MTEVPPSERTAPKSLEEMADGTLIGLRCSAVVHGWDDLVETIDQEVQSRERRQLRR